MFRKLKVTGLAAFVLALSAVGASTASAAPQFHFEAEHTIVTGAQTTANEFSFDLGKVQCGIVQYAGTSAVFTATTITLKPTFENCKITHGFEETEATVTFNNCNFVVHVGPNEEHLTGTIGIECPDFVVEIDTPECTITIPEQGNLGQVTFTNEGAATTRSVVLDLGIGGIHYQEHGLGCSSQTETTTNGTFTGKTTITGENTAGAHRGIWVE